jgi:addiction module RelE/StbE family toxin
MEIYYSGKFYREYKKQSISIKKLAEAKEQIFRKNPNDICLKTHALTGKLLGFWAFSINHKIRIIFEYKNKNTIWFHSIGSHDIYKIR